ncbi:MAG: radical SAM protein [Planctomycetota bacterium]
MIDAAATTALVPPPILDGYTYSPEEAYAARDAERLLSLRLETNATCNLRCRYCYASSDEGQGQIVDFDHLAALIEQARALGAASVVIIGGGEPTLHPRFRDLVSRVADGGMRPVVFTNTMAVTPELARFLYAAGASVMGKLDSLDEELQSYLAGIPGSGPRIHRGLDNLQSAGFAATDDPHRLRLGVSFVSCRLNVDEIPAIWRLCRYNNIFPNMEVLTPTGRAQEVLSGAGLTPEEIRDYKLRILAIDRAEFGFDWLPFTPLTASGCLQQFYSMYIARDGAVRPCAPTKFDEHPELREDGVYPHNVFRRPLTEIYHDPLFTYVRHIDDHLQGRCRGCEHLAQCVGCRGYAYAVGVADDLAPRAALAQGCRQCWKD